MTSARKSITRSVNFQCRCFPQLGIERWKVRIPPGGASNHAGDQDNLKIDSSCVNAAGIRVEQAFMPASQINIRIGLQPLQASGHRPPVIPSLSSHESCFSPCRHQGIGFSRAENVLSLCHSERGSRFRTPDQKQRLPTEKFRKGNLLCLALMGMSGKGTLLQYLCC
jgi:hypothetical protein